MSNLPKLTNINYITVALIFLNFALFIIFILIKHFPPILVLLNILSIVFLWALVFKHLKLISLFASRRKEVLLISSLVILGFFVRMYGIEDFTPGMYGDEMAIAKGSLSLLGKPDWPPFVDVNYGHPTPLLYFTGLSLQTFGHSITAIRLPSIIFGALTVGAFYILLRLFFPISISIFGAILMLFQYSNVVLSRLAYEPIPSLFWQIVTTIFLIIYWRTRKVYMLMGLALSIGAGMYTYLAFRPFAVAVVLVTLFILLRTRWKQNLKRLVCFIAIIFVVTIPLVSYYLVTPDVFSARSNQISIFSRNYSSSQFLSEFWGNIHRTALLTFFAIPNPPDNSPPVSGDPNPAHNPGNSPMFDLLTDFAAIVGLIFLFRKKRSLFWFVLLMLIPPFVSDVFSTEVTPDTNYFGYGHPNALREAGFIWVILLIVSAGFYWVYSRYGKTQKMAVLTVIGIFVVVIAYWNWYLYFEQFQISPAFYIYNYRFNHGRTVLTSAYLNKVSGQKISLTKDLVDDGYVAFFLRRPAQVSSFDLISKDNTYKIIKESDITAIGVTPQTVPILSQINQNDIASFGYSINTINNPVGQPNIYVFEKNSPISLPPTQY